MRDIKKYSEAELLQRFHKTNDIAFLTEAMLRYTPLLYSISLKYIKDKNTAQDIIHDVLIKGIERLPKHIDNLGGWLYMITRNECIDYLRLQQKTIYTEDGPNVEIHESEDETDFQLHWDKVHREQSLTEAIQLLKDDQKTCITLFFLHDKSYQDISHETGMDFKEIKSHIQNGKRNLKILLSKKR